MWRRVMFNMHSNEKEIMGHLVKKRFIEMWLKNLLHTHGIYPWLILGGLWP